MGLGVRDEGWRLSLLQIQHERVKYAHFSRSVIESSESPLLCQEFAFLLWLTLVKSVTLDFEGRSHFGGLHFLIFILSLALIDEAWERGLPNSFTHTDGKNVC